MLQERDRHQRAGLPDLPQVGVLLGRGAGRGAGRAPDLQGQQLKPRRLRAGAWAPRPLSPCQTAPCYTTAAGSGVSSWRTPAGAWAPRPCTTPPGAGRTGDGGPWQCTAALCAPGAGRCLSSSGAATLLSSQRSTRSEAPAVVHPVVEHRGAGAAERHSCKAYCKRHAAPGGTSCCRHAHQTAGSGGAQAVGRGAVREAQQSG